MCNVLAGLLWIGLNQSCSRCACFHQVHCIQQIVLLVVVQVLVVCAVVSMVIKGEHTLSLLLKYIGLQWSSLILCSPDSGCCGSPLAEGSWHCCWLTTCLLGSCTFTPLSDDRNLVVYNGTLELILEWHRSFCVFSESYQPLGKVWQCHSVLFWALTLAIF